MLLALVLGKPICHTEGKLIETELFLQFSPMPSWIFFYFLAPLLVRARDGALHVGYMTH